MWTFARLAHRGLAEFFRITLSHNSLENFYLTNFAMMQHHNYNLYDLENMIPFERDIYVELLSKHIKEENERIRREESSHSRPSSINF